VDVVLHRLFGEDEAAGEEEEEADEDVQLVDDPRHPEGLLQGGLDLLGVGEKGGRQEVDNAGHFRESPGVDSNFRLLLVAPRDMPLVFA
jgi:hypothetical protein